MLGKKIVHHVSSVLKLSCIGLMICVHAPLFATVIISQTQADNQLPITLSNNNNLFFIGPGISWTVDGIPLQVNVAPTDINISPNSKVASNTSHVILINTPELAKVVTVNNSGLLQAPTSISAYTYPPAIFAMNNSDFTLNNYPGGRIIGAIYTSVGTSAGVQPSYTLNLYGGSSLEQVIAEGFSTTTKKGVVVNILGDASTKELTNIDTINIKNVGTQFTMSSPATFNTLSLDSGTTLNVQSTLTSNGPITGTGSFIINLNSGGSLNVNNMALNSGTLNINGGLLNGDVVGSTGSTLNILANTTLGLNSSVNSIDTLNVKNGNFTILAQQLQANNWQINADRTLNILGNSQISGTQIVNNGSIILDQYATFDLLNPVYGYPGLLGGLYTIANYTKPVFTINNKRVALAAISAGIQGPSNQAELVNILNYMTNAANYNTGVSAEANNQNVRLSSASPMTIFTDGTSEGLSFSNFVLTDKISKTITITPETPSIVFSQGIYNNGIFTMNAGELNSYISNNGSLVVNGGVINGNITNNYNKLINLTSKIQGDITNNGIFNFQGTVVGNVTNNSSGVVTMGTTTTTGSLNGSVINAGTFSLNGGTISNTVTNNGIFNVSLSNSIISGGVANNGTFNFVLGNINNTVSNNSGSTFNHTGGTISGTLTNSGIYNLSGGTLNGSTINSGTLNLSSGTIGAITNSSVVNLLGGSGLVFGTISNTDNTANSILNINTTLSNNYGLSQIISGIKQINIGPLDLNPITVDFKNSISGFTQLVVNNNATVNMGSANSTLIANTDGSVINNGIFNFTQGSFRAALTNNATFNLSALSPNTATLTGNVTNNSGATLSVLRGKIVGNLNNSGTLIVNDASAEINGIITNNSIANLTRGSIGNVINNGTINILGQSLSLGTISGNMSGSSILNIQDAYTIANAINSVTEINMIPNSAKIITANAGINGFKQLTINDKTTFIGNSNITSADNGTVVNNGNLTLNSGVTFSSLFSNTGTATLNNTIVTQACNNQGKMIVQQGTSLGNITNTGELTIGQATINTLTNSGILNMQLDATTNRAGVISGTTTNNTNAQLTLSAGSINSVINNGTLLVNGTSGIVNSITNNIGANVTLQTGTVNNLLNNGTTSISSQNVTLPTIISSSGTSGILNINTPFIFNSTISNVNQVNVSPTNATDIISFQSPITGFNQILVNNGILSTYSTISAATGGNITVNTGKKLQLNTGDVTTDILGGGIVDLNGANFNNKINLSGVGSAIRINSDFTSSGTLMAENISLLSSKTAYFNHNVTATTIANDGIINLNSGILTASTVTGSALNSTTNATYNIFNGTIVGNIVKNYVSANDLLSMNFKGNFATQGTISGQGVKVTVDSGKTFTLNNQADIYSLNNDGTIILKNNINALSQIVNNGTVEVSGTRSIKSMQSLINTDNSQLKFSLFSNAQYDKLILDCSNTPALKSISVNLSDSGNNIINGDTFTIVSTPSVQQGLDTTGLNITLPTLPLINFISTKENNTLKVTAKRKPYESFTNDQATTSIASTLTDVRNSSSGSSDLYYALGKIDSLSNAESIKHAVFQLQPEIHHGIISGSYAAQNQPFDKIAYRLDLLRTNSDGFGVESGYSSGDPSGSEYTIGPMFFGNLAIQRSVPSQNIVGYHARSGGFGIFADRLLTDNIRVGTSVTYAKTNLKMPDFSHQHSTMNILQFTTYAGIDYDAWFSDIMLAISQNHYQKVRSINFPGISRVAGASYNGRQFGGKIRAGINWSLDEGITLVPLASVQYMHLNQNAYSEKGAGDIGLAFSKRQDSLLQAGLGARLVIKDLSRFDNSVIELHAISLRDLNRKNSSLIARFIGAGNTFAILPPGHTSLNSLNLGASISAMRLENMMFTLGYDLDMKKSFMSHSLMLKLRWLF